MSDDPAAFEARLRRVGTERYHHRHPFNVRMHAGTLSPEEIRTWVRNRYYYQTRIPRKDSVILTKAPDADFRRAWIQRIRDHDGDPDQAGGLELWIRLAEAVGLERGPVEHFESVLPGVRRACDAYVEFVEQHDLLDAVASSLTELFAGELMANRIDAFEKHYPWVDAEGLSYFRTRTHLAPRDAAFGLRFVVEQARDAEAQQRCVEALERKCEILWGLLDAVESAHRAPRISPHAQLRSDPDQADKWLAVLPERAVRVNEAGHEILQLCDGERATQALVEVLLDRHPGVEHLAEDVHDFLENMARIGVVTGLEPER